MHRGRARKLMSKEEVIPPVFICSAIFLLIITVPYQLAERMRNNIKKKGVQTRGMERNVNENGNDMISSVRNIKKS